MRESMDWPPMQPPHRRRRRFFLIVAVLAGIFFGSRTALSYYVDVLWFASLGYRDVFWKTLSLQWGIFAAFATATFLILYGSFLALKRAHLPDLPHGHTTLARALHCICISVANSRDACLSGAVRAIARRSYDLRRCDLHGRPCHAHRDARRLCGIRSGRGNRSRQRCAGATGTVAV